MLRLLSDENVNGHIIAGIRQHYPQVDLIRVQDNGLSGVEDPAVLDWAGTHGRILLTQDVKTMIVFAMDRIARGLAMPGVFVLRQGTTRPHS